MRATGWIWILTLLLLGGIGGWRISRGKAVQADLLAMLPKTEKNPVAELALLNLAQASGQRVVLLVGHFAPSRAKAAALELATRLEQSGAFAHVLGRIPPIDPTQVARFYAPYRFRLPGSLSAEDPADQIQSRLAAPQGAIGGLGIARDPLGQLDDFLAALPLSSFRLELSDDLLLTRTEKGCFVLVLATLSGSAFDSEVQARSVAAVKAAEAALPRDLTILHTGAVFYAEQARSGAEREMNRISLLSILAIVMLYLVVFRTFKHLVLGLTCVLAGLVLATSISLLFYGQLYLLTLVSGASVLGVAVDYSFLYFAHHQGSGSAWEPRGALRRLSAPLVIGFLTTLVGYAALMVTPFPGLRQIAFFTFLGLGGALLSVFLILPDALASPAREHPALSRLLAGVQGLAQSLADRRDRAVGFLAILLLLAMGAVRIRTLDDASALIQTAPILLQEEARIRSLTGLSIGGTFFLVDGQSEAEVLSREESLRLRLEPLVKTGELEKLEGVSCFVPSPKRQADAVAQQIARLPRVETALGEIGFRPEVIRTFRADLEASTQKTLTVANWLEQPFSTPHRLLWLGATSQGFASVLLPAGTPDRNHMLEAVAGLPGVSYVDKAAGVSALLGRYRRLATGVLALAALGIWGALAFRYGPLGAFWVLVPAVCGVLLPLAVLGLLGFPLTLFGVLGLLLTLGFAVDYAVFLREGGTGDTASLLGVFLAGASTFISYGLLAFSQTPVLRDFGLVIALGVLGSIFSSFFALRDQKPGTTP